MDKIKTFDCPQCKKTFNISPQMAGKRYRCKLCSGVLVIPQDFFDEHEQFLNEIPFTLPPNKPVNDILKPKQSSRRISFRTAIGALALIIVSVLGYIAFGPFITMYQIKNGIVKGDSDGLNENIDFPALKENLKSQINVQMMKKMTTELKGNPFASLGMGLASKLTDGMVDSFVSPAGLSALLDGNRFNINSHRSNEKKEISFIEFLKNFDYAFESTSKFSVWLKSKERSKFVLSRQGFGWKLTNISIPVLNDDPERHTVPKK